MVIENWFSTPILYYQLEGDELETVQKQIEQVMDKVREMDLSNPWDDTVSTSFKYKDEHNFIVDYNLRALEKVIVKCTESYLNKVKTNTDMNLGIKKSWINFSNRHQFQFEHDHVGLFSSVVLSGIYYYQTNGNDGNLAFVSPNPFQSANMSAFGDSKVTYKPAVGKLLLFPSWLKHRVETNVTDGERISIAFNLAHYSTT